ncbi:hypothetical protein ACSBOX_03765 [Arthrobacter sp. KN11-1C]|uniref:hypothetical protein n=1 Tax=Arthrobacter sp. KN11-1C TaxID=3445774 RepID=UPI003F9F4316
MIEPTAQRPEAATVIFNLPDYRVIGTEVLAFGQRRICIELTAEAGYPPCGRRTFVEEKAQVPRRARSTRRLRDALVSAVIASGRAVSETVASFGVSWWLVQRALDTAARTLPDVDPLASRLMGID